MTKRNLLLFIILIGVIIRICLIYFAPDIRTSSCDAWKYDRLAQNMVDNGIYSLGKVEGHRRPSAIYPPIYPILIASVYYIIGHKPIIISYFNIAFYAVACIAIFRLSSVFFNEKTGVFGVLFFTLEPLTSFFSISALPDMLMVVFMLFGIYYLIRFLKQDVKEKTQYRDLILSAIFLSGAMLTKPVMFYFPLISIFFIFAYQRRPIKKFIISALILIFVISLVVSPWIVRNYIVWNKFVFVKTYGFIPPEKEAIVKKIGYTRATFRKVPEAVRNATLRYAFGTGTMTFYRALFRTNTLKEYYMSLKRDVHIGKGKEVFYLYDILKGNIAKEYIQLIKYSRRFAVFEFFLLSILLVIYAFALMGVYFAAKDRKGKELLVIIFIISYFAAIIIVAITANSAYRFPSAPFYCILAGYGLNRLILYRKEIRERVIT